MTIACLLVNTVRAACAIAGLPAPRSDPSLNRAARRSTNRQRDGLPCVLVCSCDCSRPSLAVLARRLRRSRRAAPAVPSSARTRRSISRNASTRPARRSRTTARGAAPATPVSRCSSPPAISGATSAMARTPRREKAAEQTLAAFNSEGKTIEWRIERPAGGKPHAFATILRWNVTTLDDDTNQVARPGAGGDAARPRRRLPCRLRRRPRQSECQRARGADRRPARPHVPVRQGQADRARREGPGLQRSVRRNTTRLRAIAGRGHSHCPSIPVSWAFNLQSLQGFFDEPPSAEFATVADFRFMQAAFL